jgi:hypothetical protein
VSTEVTYFLSAVAVGLGATLFMDLWALVTCPHWRYQSAVRKVQVARLNETVPGCELRRRHASNRTVWSRLVVIAAPRGDHGTRMGKSVEVVIIEALVPKFAIETLDIRVLRWLAGGNQLQVDAAAVGPSSSARLVNSGP